MNKVMLIGNVGQEPEVRYVDQGVAVARIRWRRMAEIVEKYVHKGDKLYIEGRIRYTTYDDKQGQRRYATEIWADNLELLSPKPATSAAVNESLDAPQPDTKPDEGLPF